MKENDETPQESPKVIQKEEEEEKKPRHVIIAYRDRVILVKQARMFENKGEMANSINAYEKYLSVLSQYLEVSPEKLHPSLFKNAKGKEDLHEILLISLVSWGLSKSYSKIDNPKLREKTRLMLDRFVLFTLGFKFQYLNCDTVRKFLKSKRGFNHDLFEDTFKRLRISSKSCYVATYCYDENHPKVELLRKFKKILIRTSLGEQFVIFYYDFSPKLVKFCQKNRKTGIILKNFIFKPILNCIARVLKIFIIN